MTFKWTKRVGLSGACAFALLLCEFHIWHNEQIFRATLYLSSPNLDICNVIDTHLFRSRAIAPPRLFFEFCLTVITVIELSVVGLIADFLLWRHRRSRPQTELPKGARTRL